MKLLSVTLGLVLACATARASTVVASFSILASLAREIAPPGIDVASLVPAGSDAHTFEARPADLKTLKSARVIFAVGAGFEPWLAAAAKAAGGPAKPVLLGETVPLRGFAGGKDPHFWHDPRKVMVAVDRMSEVLGAEFPGSAGEIARRAGAFKDRLRKLHEEIAAGFAALPKDHRIVVTSHDAFGDLAETYDLRMWAPQGWSTDAEPTAKSVARLIRQIRETKARALFLENLSDAKIMRQISRETGVAIGGTLYADSLSEPGGPAADYESLMRSNAEKIRKALRP